MKSLICSLCSFLFFLDSGIAQVSDTYFESMGPNLNFESFYGIKTTEGALGLRIADSINSEIQWVKTDLNGGVTFFSSDLPTNQISEKERIFDVYDDNTNQFIVTTDSNSYLPAGIRIHKYLDYSNYQQTFQYNTLFYGRSITSIFRDGKIFIFFINSTSKFIRLKINPTTLELEEELILVDNFSNFGNINRNLKSIHIRYFDINNMDIYTNASSQLFRVKIQNNIVEDIDFKEIKLRKILGINEQLNQIVCLVNSTESDLHFYHFENNMPLSTIFSEDSLSLSDNTPMSLKDWLAKIENNKIFLSRTTGDSRVILLENNQIIENNNTGFNVTVRNVDFHEGNPIAFGLIRSTIFAPNGFNNFNFLFVSHGSIVNLFNFKEYVGKYIFDNKNIKHGIGNAIFASNFSNSDQNIFFNRTIYSANQLFLTSNIDGDFFSLYNQQYKPGPYTNINFYDQYQVIQYNENYYIDLEMCNQHITNFNNPNYQIPKAILFWPAHGDVNKGQAENLAPFADLNSNQIYEPLLGEFPSFPGDYCLFNITHQNENDLNGTGTGLELHTYLYKFNCEDVLNDVVFLKTEVYNRGAIEFDTLASGIFVDFDLGGYNDDYVGTHVDNGLIYAYNGDLYDDTTGAIPGFGDSLPTVAIQFLKGIKFPNNELDDLKGINPNQTVNGYGFNNQIIDDEFKGLEYSRTSTNSEIITEPTPLNYYYNFMTGNNTLIGPNDMNYRYSFPGSSDPSFYGTYGIDPGFNWSEETTFSAPSDRRMCGAFGATSLYPGQKITFHSAFLEGKRAVGAGQSQIDLFAKAVVIKKAFENNKTSCGKTFDNLTENDVHVINDNLENLEITVFPNPFFSELYVEISDLDDNTSLIVFDLNGKKLIENKITTKFHVVNTNNFASGIYFLKVENLKGKSVKKAIKL